MIVAITREIDSQLDYLYNVTLMIGEFEYLLIAASLRLAEEAYGASIRREVEEATERPCSIGSLYTTLDRLEAKGLVKTWMGEATAQRGGRAKRMVSVTAKGVESASAFYRAISRVSRDISWEARCHFSQD
jgi:PadR family transcriptional regulator, regulatory protein PadR